MPTAPNPAELYERFFVPAMFQPWSTILLRHAALAAGERVLDVACGTGIVARQAASLVGPTGRVVGVDLNPAMLAVARDLPREPAAALEYQQANAQALPFEVGSFEVVLCQHGLPFFPDRAKALAEFRRVLAPGGRVSVMVLQTLAQHPAFKALFESVAKHLAQPLAAVMTPFALSDEHELQRLFEAAGFSSVTISAEHTTVTFSDADRFVPLAVHSSAAAIPAFATLAAPAQGDLMNAVRLEVEPTLAAFRRAGALSFPMAAWVVDASR